MQYFQSSFPVLVLDSSFVIREVSNSAKEIFALGERIVGRSIFPFVDLEAESSIRIPRDLKINSRQTVNGVEIDALLLSLSPSSPEYSYLLILSADAAGGSTDIQSSKLKALGTLAGGIAHDLNNMLMAVLGHLSYLRISNANLNNESLQAAEEGARMAAKLSQQILDFARRQQVSPDKIDICQVITSAIPLFSPSLPVGIDVSFKALDSPLYVSMDESQVTQIVLNLLVNARDAMGERGKVTLELDRLSFKSGKLINGFTIVQGDYARILVKDTGHGMSEDIKSKIFEPFFTTKRGTGTGLGLATVFFLIKSLRGAIDVHSEPGKGTSFSVLLPLSDVYEMSDSLPIDKIVGSSSSNSKIEFARNISKEGENTPSQIFKILVVDDEDAVRMVLQKSLELLGYEVLTAESGADALTLFSESFQDISLVVMDMIMPHMPGHELFYELKKLDPSVKVLISSGYSSDGKTQELLSNGARGFIQKPFAIEELALEVERCLSS